LNRSLCHLRMGRLEDCVRDCDWVLDSRGGELKAMFRRGKARVGLAEHRRDARQTGSPLAADAGRTFKRPRNSLEFERIWKELYKDLEQGDRIRTDPTIASVIPELFKDSLQPELLHQICHSFLLHIRISKPKPSPSEIRTMIRWIESLTLCRRFSTISSLLDVEERKVVEGLFQHL
ncbi:hypothetical protein IE53DRAFT_306624, partial [Violaceomyces palustris]